MTCQVRLLVELDPAIGDVRTHLHRGHSGRLRNLKGLAVPHPRTEGQSPDVLGSLAVGLGPALWAGPFEKDPLRDSIITRNCGRAGHACNPGGAQSSSKHSCVRTAPVRQLLARQAWRREIPSSTPTHLYLIGRPLKRTPSHAVVGSPNPSRHLSTGFPKRTNIRIARARQPSPSPT